MSLVSSPRSRFSPINSAKTTARNGAAATDSHERPAVVMSARKVVPAVDRRLDIRCTAAAVPSLLGAGPPLVDHVPQPGDLVLCRR